MAIYRITTGFLTGNLFSETDGIDIEASISKYHSALTSALQDEFPDASIDVRYQNASGCLPFGLQTHVECDPEDNEEDLIERVDSLKGTVYSAFELWVVVQNGYK